MECSPSRRWLVDGYELCASDVLEVGGEAWLSDEAFKDAVADDGGGSGSGLCIALVKKIKKIKNAWRGNQAGRNRKYSTTDFALRRFPRVNILQGNGK